MFLPHINWSSPAEVIATESHYYVQKHVVTNWDGLDAKAFAGIYKSNWVCSVAGDGKIANLFFTVYIVFNVQVDPIRPNCLFK